MWNVGEDQYLYYERGLRIRFRAQSVRFLAVPTLADQAKQREEGQAVVGTAERPFVPMQVVGRTDGDGNARRSNVCGKCGQTGHNVRTCPSRDRQAVESSQSGSAGGASQAVASM